jgi:AhpD family alkylhydroperoxidase
MNDLSFTERELVALGAALGSNCVPCIEHHITEARRAGLTDPQISAAIQLADQIRKVPAAKVIDAALRLLGEKPLNAGGRAALCSPATWPGTGNGPCCS